MITTRQDENQKEKFDHKAGTAIVAAVVMASCPIYGDSEDNGGSVDPRLLMTRNECGMAGPSGPENQENRSPGGTIAGPLLPAPKAQRSVQATSNGLWSPYHGKTKLHRLSKLAKTYGVRNIRLTYPERDGHTGLTPLPLSSPTGDEERDNLLSYMKQRMQKLWTNGWTSRDMWSLDALPTYHESHQRLPNDPNWRPRTLHPLVERSQWRTRYDLGAGEDFLPIGSGLSGYYNAANDDVWNLMLPALRAVSNMLDAAEDSQWWNAFLDPKQYSTAGADFFPEPWRTTFTSKTGPVDLEEKRRIRWRLRDLAPHIKLEVNNCEVNTHQSRLLEDKKAAKDAGWGVLGNTCSFVRPGSAREGQSELQALVTMSYKFLYHMLSGHHNESEMYAAQALFAETLLHELTHALFVAMTIDGDRRDRHPLSGEAYHGDEVYRELGWSMSNSFFGISSFLGPAPPAFGTLTRPWPTLYDQRSAPMKLEELMKVQDGTSKLKHDTHVIFYPIPVSYQRAMLSQGFWDQRNAQGGGSMPHKQPTICGRGYHELHIGHMDYYKELDFDSTEAYSKSNDPGSAYWKDRYRLSTNEYQKLKASFSAETKFGYSVFSETYAKQKLAGLPSDKHRLHGLANANQLKEKQSLAGPGDYSDFDWDEDVVPQEPPSFRYIYNAVQRVRKRCCFETMIKHRPAYLVLGYINRTLHELHKEGRLVQCREIELDEWLDFLEYVSSRGKLFQLYDYKEVRKYNNAPRGCGVESIAYIPSGWSDRTTDFYPTAIDHSNVPRGFQHGEYEALGIFVTFMKVFSGQEDRRDQLRLLRSALGIWFLHAEQDFDLDSATFNRCYNVYLDRENARLKRTARHKWNGPPVHLDLELMIWAFGSDQIKGWALGPFNTLRYVAGGYLYSLTEEEHNYFSLKGDAKLNIERQINDRSVEEVKEDERRRANHKQFIHQSFETLYRTLQENEQNSRLGNNQHQDIDTFRKKWDEMRRACLPVERWEQYLGEQVKEEGQLRRLQQNETLLKQLGRKWMREEEERKRQREALVSEFGELMQNHWYKERGLYDGRGSVAGQCFLFDLTRKVNEAIGDQVGTMTLAEQMQLDYDKQNHIVSLQDLGNMLEAMTRMGYGHFWGYQVPDVYILPSVRRQDLWHLQATQEDDFRNSPQWFCTEEQKEKLWLHIAWRTKSAPCLGLLGESESKRWERKQVQKYQEMKRQKGGGGPRSSKYNPLPFTMVDASLRRGRDLLHRSERDATLEGRHPLPSRPPNIYGGDRGRQGAETGVPERQRGGRSRSPEARRRRYECQYASSGDEMEGHSSSRGRSDDR